MGSGGNGGPSAPGYGWGGLGGYRLGTVPAPSIIAATSPAITMTATTIITIRADLAPGTSGAS